MAIKHLWKGLFNYTRQLHVLYCYAYTKRQAWLSFCRQLSRRHNVPLNYVTCYFDGSKDNYEIEIEMEVREVGEE